MLSENVVIINLKSQYFWIKGWIRSFTIKIDIKANTRTDTLEFLKNVNLISLKSETGNLDVNKLRTSSSDLRNKI